MAKVSLSEAEMTLILHGVQDDLRTDGRENKDYRLLELETEIVTHASGSSRVRLASTDILVGVKAEIDAPFPGTPKEGKLEFFVDCSANATPEFEGRGGENLATEISRALSRAYSSHSVFDRTKLGIIPGRQCWILYVDILILECGGNLFDAVSVAVKAALFNTKIPNVKIANVDAGIPDIELSDDPYDYRRLNVSTLPCLVTFTKIGPGCVVDPTPEEEACSKGSLVVAVTEAGTVTAVKKRGAGSFHQDTIISTLQAAKELGRSLNVQLMVKLEEEEKLDRRQTLKGFLR